MNARFFLFFFLVVPGNSYAQKSKFKIPPGTIQVNDSLYIDVTEVANVHWREYLHYLREVDSTNLFNAFPDTTIWSGSEKPEADYYFVHPQFNNYPVVGISYAQALAFCKWRTFVANLGMYLRENNLKDWKLHLNDDFPIRFYYRLPTKEEWEMIAASDMNEERYPFGYDSVSRKWKGKYRAVFNCIYPDSSSNKHFFYTVPIRSYYPNSSGTYEMIGNVAEMTLEEGIAKGGSFAHPLDSCKIRMDQHYSNPEKWLGFRCVAVMSKSGRNLKIDY